MIELSALKNTIPVYINDKNEQLANAESIHIGEICEELALYYRVSAAASLLLDLDVEQFNHMLIRSALTRVYLLRSVSDHIKQSDRFCKSSRANGFFCALAAERFDIAKDIAGLSPKRNTQFEYEDDYDYILFLHKFVSHSDNSTLQKIIDQFELDLQGTKSLRLNVCKALLEENEEDFEDYFLALLNDWKQSIDYQKTSMTRDEVAFAGDQYIFVEGLALLRIAEHLGFTIQEEYDYCPKEARRVISISFDIKDFPLVKN